MIRRYRQTARKMDSRGLVGAGWITIAWDWRMGGADGATGFRVTKIMGCEGGRFVHPHIACGARTGEGEGYYPVARVSTATGVGPPWTNSSFGMLDQIATWFCAISSWMT